MKHVWVLSLLMFSTVASADFFDKVHTWHNVSANVNATCHLSHALEKGYHFVNSTGPIDDFFLPAGVNYTYGLVLGTIDNFNLIYTLACRRDDGLLEKSPKVIFVIGANKAADPNIHIVDEDGGVGYVHNKLGVGEDFEMDLQPKKLF